MVDLRQRPLVLGSVTLALSFGLLEILNETVGEWGVYGVFAIAVSSGVWWLQRSPAPKETEPVLPRYVEATAVKQALAAAERVIARLQTETEDEQPAIAAIKPQVSLLQAQAAQVGTELHRETVRIVVMGAKGCGKTSLIDQLQAQWLAAAPAPVVLYEAPSFTAGLEGDLAVDAIAVKQAATADLVLFMVTGDLTASELHTLQQVATRKRTLLVLNKQDQYLPDERRLLVQRMQNWCQGLVQPEEVLAIATAPRPLKVRQHQDTGTVQEWLEEQVPDLARLPQTLDALLQAEQQYLVMASALDQAQTLRTQAIAALNAVRRTRALPTIEKFQWMTAATAFASPVPTVDILATAAINVQMILDLGVIYQQKFSVEQAQKVVTALGSFILKLGLVELSTRAIASLLKTNAITYIAGGGIQAVSAAYLTRMAGLTLVEYFDTQEPNLTLAEAKPLAIERLGAILEQVFHKNQQLNIFQTLTTQVMERLTPKAAKPTAPITPAPIGAPPQPPTPPAPTPPLVPPKKPENNPLFGKLAPRSRPSSALWLKA